MCSVVAVPLMLVCFLIFVFQLSALSCHTSNFGVAILVIQQSFLQMETKSIQKNSFCTVGNIIIIQFLKTKINLEKYENPIFSIRLTRAQYYSLDLEYSKIRIWYWILLTRFCHETLLNTLQLVGLVIKIFRQTQNVIYIV